MIIYAQIACSVVFACLLGVVVYELKTDVLRRGWRYYDWLLIYCAAMSIFGFYLVW